jgi:hypothetical protein
MKRAYLFISVTVLLVMVFTGLAALGAMNHNTHGAQGLCPFGSLSGNNCPTGAFVSVNHHAGIFQLLTQPTVSLKILLVLMAVSILGLIFRRAIFLLQAQARRNYINNFQIADRVTEALQKVRHWFAVYTRGFPLLSSISAR